MRTLNKIHKDGRKFIHKNKLKPSYFNDKGKTMSYYNEEGTLRLSDHWPSWYKLPELPISSNNSDFLFLGVKVGNEWMFTGVKFKRVIFDDFNEEDVLGLELKRNLEFE